ncbi:MAG: PEP-CTERM sorting domain-containing protein [Betaproteobacteria bacterium]
MYRPARSKLVLAVLFCAFPLSASANLVIVDYSILDLGVPSRNARFGFSSQAASISDTGRVVGTWFTTAASTTEQGFRSSIAGGNYKLLDLGLPAGVQRLAPTGVNSSGTTVGWIRRSGTDHALYNGTEIAGVQGRSQLLAVNDKGQAVGFDASAGGKDQALYYAGTGNATSIAKLKGIESRAQAVNEFGGVVGYYVENSIRHAFAYDTDTASLLTLPTLGSGASAAAGINDSGLITGNFATQPGGPQHAFLFDGKEAHDLGVPAGYTDSSGLAISNQGWVIGEARGDNGRTAFLSVASTLFDLSDLADLAGAGWLSLDVATSINNGNVIVGQGTLLDGSKRAFLLTLNLRQTAPVPEPGSWAFLVAGAAFLAGRIRRGV